MVESIFGDDIEAEGLDSLDFIEAAQDLSGFSSARLIIEFQANETVWIDDIQFVEGVIPAPGAVAAPSAPVYSAPAPAAEAPESGGVS